LDFLSKSTQITLYGRHILVTASGSRQFARLLPVHLTSVQNRREIAQREMEWRQSAMELRGRPRGTATADPSPGSISSAGRFRDA